MVLIKRFYVRISEILVLTGGLKFIKHVQVYRDYEDEKDIPHKMSAFQDRWKMRRDEEITMKRTLK